MRIELIIEKEARRLLGSDSVVVTDGSPYWPILLDQWVLYLDREWGTTKIDHHISTTPFNEQVHRQWFNVVGHEIITFTVIDAHNYRIGNAGEVTAFGVSNDALSVITEAMDWGAFDTK